MKNTIRFFQLVQLCALTTLLFLLAIIPFIIAIDIITAFVVLPTLFIVLSFVSIIIEQKLLSLDLAPRLDKSNQACTKHKCLLKSCFCSLPS